MSIVRHAALFKKIKKKFKKIYILHVKNVDDAYDVLQPKAGNDFISYICTVIYVVIQLIDQNLFPIT